MFGQPTRSRNRNGTGEGEVRQPLLPSRGSREDLTEERTIFSVEDSDDDELEQNEAFNSPQRDRPEHSVRFQEDVQVIGPPLRSTMQSREAGESALDYTACVRFERNAFFSQNMIWIQTSLTIRLSMSLTNSKYKHLRDTWIKPCLFSLVCLNLPLRAEAWMVLCPCIKPMVTMSQEMVRLIWRNWQRSEQQEGV